MITVALLHSDGSASITLPSEMLSRHRMDTRADQLLAIETDRGILLLPYDPGLEQAMQIHDDVIMRYDDVFRMLGE